MASGIFENQDVSAPQMGFSPQQAVAPVNDNTAGAVLGGVAQVAQVGLQLWAGRKQQEAVRAKNTATGQFASYITNLNAAVEQGSMKQADAQRLQRAKFNQLIAANPALTDDLVALNSGLAKSSGLGDTLAQGTAVEQQYTADLKKATGSGWIHQGMTQEQQEAAVNGMRQQEHAAAQMDFYSKQLNIQNQKLSMQEKSANIANAQAQRANAVLEAKMKSNQLQVRNGLNGAVQSEYERQRNQIQALQNNTLLSPEEKVRQITEMQQQFQGQLMQYRGIAGSDYVDGLTKPFAELYKSGADYASGKIQGDVYQAQVDAAQAKSLLPFAADPKYATGLALAKTLGPAAGATVINRITPQLMDKYDEILAGGNYNPTSSSKTDKADTKTHTDILKSTIDALSAKSPLIDDVKGTQSELHQHVNAILSGTVDFASSQKSPGQMNNVMDFLASPQFLKYRQMGGTIDETVAANIENVIGTNYTDKLSPVIRDAWEQAKVTTGFTVDTSAKAKYAVGFANVQEQTADTSSALEYVFRSGALTFRPKKGYEGNPAVKAKADELNQKVAPLVNKTVRAAAHLQGNDDFDSAFKKYESDFFGEPNNQPVAPEGGESVNGR